MSYPQNQSTVKGDLDQGSPIIQTGEISLNTVTREVKRGNQEIVLTSKEYAILEYFMRNPKAILTRQMIENHIWNLSLIRIKFINYISDACETSLT